MNMDFLKELFGEDSLSYEELSQKVTEKGYKIADLSTGNYVSKRKFDDEIASRDTTISDLNGQITTRDTDISNLKKELEDGGKDNKTKVAELTEKISKLQGDYENVKTDYEARLTKQSYEFAVREFANGKQFTSNAAKRDFINEMLSADLKMKDKTILGAEDFVTQYAETNADAFKVDEEPEPTPAEPEKPTFGQPTPPQATGDENAFTSLFTFQELRPH